MNTNTNTNTTTTENTNTEISAARIKELESVARAATNEFYAKHRGQHQSRGAVLAVMAAVEVAWAVYHACETPLDLEWYRQHYRTCQGCGRPLTYYNDVHWRGRCDKCWHRAQHEEALQ